MGVSTLHHDFRALTAMSPLRYQKQLRLFAARKRMLVEGLDAATAAFEVGYENPSQFNRESTGSPVSNLYQSPFRFTGTLNRIEVDIAPTKLSAEEQKQIEQANKVVAAAVE